MESLLTTRCNSTCIPIKCCVVLYYEVFLMFFSQMSTSTGLNGFTDSDSSMVFQSTSPEMSPPDVNSLGKQIITQHYLQSLNAGK